ncbi:MAG: hypothetical protein ACI9X4_000563 [Glaciecola sp.]|jgi:hypothetical protein
MFSCSKDKMLRSKLLLPGLAIALAGGAIAQNDDCSAALAIGTTGTFAFDTTANTTSFFDGTGLCVGGDNVTFDTFYQWTAPAAGDYQFDTETSTFDTQLSLHAGVGCAATCTAHDDDAGTGLLSSITLSSVGAGDMFLIQVGGFGAGQGIGNLNISTYVDPCIAIVDDTFEDNDTCSAAATMSIGLHTGLFVSDSDADNYEITIPTGEVLDLTIFINSGDVDYNIYDNACGFVANGFGGFIYSNTTGAPETIVVEIVNYAFSGATCAEYDLDIYSTPVASNDDCSTASPLAGTGTFPFSNSSATTSFFNGGGSCDLGADSNNQDIFYQWIVPATGDYQFDTDTSSYDTKLSIHAGIGCAATCVAYDDDAGIGLQSLIQLPGLIAGDSYLLQVGAYGGNAGTGVLTIGTYVDPCNGIPDDSLEDNDSCATAGVMANGVYTNLHVTVADADYYSITIPAGENLTVIATNLAGGTNLGLYDNTCFNLGFFGGTYSNISGAPETVIVEVTADTFSGNCADYDLDVSTAPDPCQSGADDTLEENDDCGTATIVTDGTYPNLFVSKSDMDHYAFCLADGATVDCDILFLDAAGDLDFVLWTDGDINCGTGFGTTMLANGFSVSDNETLSWTNTTGADIDLILEVNTYTGSVSDCNTYDLVIFGEGCGPGGATGTPFCDPANLNSTGAPAVLTGSTGTGVGSDVHLEITGGPVGQLAYMLAGNEATAGIPVSNGLFCLVGTPTAQFFRYNVGGTDMNSIGGFDPTGTWINAVGTSTTGFGFDVPSTIPDGVPIVILAGDTWHFQGWYRDTAAASGSSNFTNGLSVTF